MRIADNELCPCESGRTYANCHKKQPSERAGPLVHVKLAVIPEPDPGSRTVFDCEGPTTVFFKGYGPHSLDCGDCGEPLAVGVARDQFSGLVLQCCTCGSYNDT
jgi:hypothetical protein